MTDAPLAPPVLIGHPASIARRLSAEWHHRTMRACDLRLVRSWRLPGDEIMSLDDVLDRCGFTPPPEPGGVRSRRRRNDPAAEASHDAYLLQLLTLAGADELAARIVLQRILPPLCGIARRHSSPTRPFHELLDDLVANAWVSIRAYPVERRPHRIVANLVRDIGFQTIVRPTRRRGAGEVPSTAEGIGDAEIHAERHPLVELVELLHEAQRSGVVSERDVQLIRELIRLGRPEHLAAIRNVSSRTVRNHRDAIVHRLRGMALEAA